VSDAEDDYYGNGWGPDLLFWGGIKQDWDQTEYWNSRQDGRVRIKDMHASHRSNSAALARQWGKGDTQLCAALEGRPDMRRTVASTTGAHEKVAAMRSLAERLAEQAIAKEAEANALQRLLEEEPTHVDGDDFPIVLMWKESFGKVGGHEYTYTAAKPAGSSHWYTSDGSGNRYTWDGLVQRFYGIRHKKYWVAETWRFAEDSTAQVPADSVQQLIATKAVDDAAPYGRTPSGRVRRAPKKTTSR
jgi:hypothetical protein